MITQEREPMKIGQLHTAFLGQGFKLIDVKKDSDNEENVLENIELSDTTTDDSKVKMKIYCTQFLINLQIKVPSKKECIIHAYNSRKKLFRYSIDGQICEDIINNIIELKDMFKFL